MRKTVLVLATVASSLALAACSRGEEAAPAATEEAAAGPFSGRESHRFILNANQRMLMLKTLAGQSR